ncbi:MAG: hypothetical protein II998_03140 [Clostridia bacterium]|nr:hypothetical protein [Clostridia bacterium]
MISKKFKKLFSIVLTTVFVLSIFSVQALAVDYNASVNSNGEAALWKGSNVPYASMVSPDGTLPAVSQIGLIPLTEAAVLEYSSGVYGKTASDGVYKTYDYATRDNTTDLSSGRGAFQRGRMPSVDGQDVVYEFSFLYESCRHVTNNWNRTPIVRTGYKLYSAPNGGTQSWIYNMFFVSTNGFYFATESASQEDKTVDMKDNFTLYEFEPKKWYSVSLALDFAKADDAEGTTYTHKAYINGELCATYSTTTPYYRASNLCTYPANGAVVYWDNLQVYTGADFDVSTYNSSNRAAELASSDSAISVSDDMIKVMDTTATVGDVKTAIAASVKDDEAVRVYNSDYSAELGDDASAVGAKLVVAQTRTFLQSVKVNAVGAATSLENNLTYYDIVPDSYIFDEPTITVDSEAGTATGNVKLTNYTGDEQSFKVYLAVYEGHELVGISIASSDFVADADKTEAEFTTPSLDFASGNVAKLFVWKADGITPELVSTSTN